MKFDIKTKISLVAIALAGFVAGFVFAGGFGLLPSAQAEPEAGNLTTLKEIGSGFSTIAGAKRPIKRIGRVYPEPAAEFTPQNQSRIR